MIDIENIKRKVPQEVLDLCNQLIEEYFKELNSKIEYLERKIDEIKVDIKIIKEGDNI